MRTAPRVAAPLGPVRWTVPGEDGAVLRHVLVPAGVEVRDASGSRLRGAATDDLGVSWVVGLELSAAGGG